jgi:hypothetical protein
MKFVLRRAVALTAVVITALLPPLVAQRATHAVSPVKPTSPHGHLATRSFVSSRDGHESGFRRSGPLTSFVSPFFDDFYNPDDGSSEPEPSAPPAFLMQGPRAPSGYESLRGGPTNDTGEADSSQPLMIELQGDRYVRVSSAAVDGDAVPLRPNPDSAPARSVVAKLPASDLPSAVLVFRDGHSEEVHDYTIADGFLYARGNYYTDGYWDKKIDLSALDVAETVKANAMRNVKFVLPSSPNEVITRP